MIWIIYILCDAIANWYLIEKKHTRPNYLMLFIIRGIAAILYGAFIADVSEQTFWLWLNFVVLSFPFPFNFLLNLMRRKPFDYYGAESGIIDRFVVKYKLHGAYFLLTILMFAISIFAWTRMMYA